MDLMAVMANISLRAVAWDIGQGADNTGRGSPSARPAAGLAIVTESPSSIIFFPLSSKVLRLHGVHAQTGSSRGIRTCYFSRP